MTLTDLEVKSQTFPGEDKRSRVATDGSDQPTRSKGYHSGQG